MSIRKKRRGVIDLVLFTLLLSLCGMPQFLAFVTFPDPVRLSQGQEHDFRIPLPSRASVMASTTGEPAHNGEHIRTGGSLSILSSRFSIAAVKTGQTQVDFRLFGVIPFRRTIVDEVPPIKVIPGGHFIGVLRSRGVTVVGFEAVTDAAGAVHHPGLSNGIELGDVILAVDDTEVTSAGQVARLFEIAGEERGPVSVTIERNGQLIRTEMLPIRENESGKWRVGLDISDGPVEVGAGTVTFYHPDSGKFGALGHVMADFKTSQPIDLGDGHIADAMVTAVQRGQEGLPGEMTGQIKDDGSWTGSIKKNSRFGIFGVLNRPLVNPLFREPIPVAMASQVSEGPAEILSVVEGQKLERYTVQLLRVVQHPTADGKNITIKVTDPRLLEKTGGIVQGMSGSPILQDGRLVGSVTHLKVNDPTIGYGVLIEPMLQEAEILKHGSSALVIVVYSIFIDGWRVSFSVGAADLKRTISIENRSTGRE